MSKGEAKINQELLMLGKDQVPKTEASLSQSQERKLLMVSTMPQLLDLKANTCSDSEEEKSIEIVETLQKITCLKLQDVDYIVSQIFDELKVEIFARMPCFEYWKLHFLNKKFSKLVKSGEIFKVRRERGIVKPYVFILSGSDTHWTMFDEKFEKFRKLPELPSDQCFFYGHKEPISAGTQLIIIGNELEGIVMWRYELEMHQWFKGPAMITPRIMYGSATRGNDIFFAGGIKIDKEGIAEVVNVVEKYNVDTKTWKPIREMNKRRKFSSGCFLRGKFYVLGGQDEKDKYLTCGESYDEETNSWKLIPDMLKGMTHSSLQLFPLIAVVNDNLYSLETSSNELLVYDTNANEWKKLGILPVRVDVSLGYGAVFKSIGDRILVIGSSTPQFYNMTMEVYTCRPSPGGEELVWQEYKPCCDGAQFNQFIRNCCVMFV